MDKIIFKAYQRFPQEWVEGNLYRDDEGRAFIYREDKDLIFEVVPDTICQSVGRRDHDGNMIFENDFVLVDSHRGISIVEIIDGGVYLYSDGEREDIYGIESKDMKVIGNRCDNGEN